MSYTQFKNQNSLRIPSKVYYYPYTSELGKAHFLFVQIFKQMRCVSGSDLEKVH